nr:PREDICTED: uncharacterized protein LOC109029548 isoform X1 [Bemisia tabaci]
MKVAIPLCIILPFVAAFLSTPLEDIPDSSNGHLMPLVLEKEPSKKPPEIKKTRTNNDEVEGTEMEQMLHGQARWMSNIKDEGLREEAIFNALKAEKIQSKINGELSARVKFLSGKLWIVRARSAIEDVERRFKIARITLSNEEAEGATDDFEYRRILREKRWKMIFKIHKGNWEIREIITKIQSKNSDVKALDDFASDISVAYSLLSDDIHSNVFTKGTMTDPIFTAHLKKNTKASSAVQLLLSLLDLEPPGHARKKRNANPSTREN